jgi:hypothetical protein
VHYKGNFSAKGIQINNQFLNDQTIGKFIPPGTQYIQPVFDENFEKVQIYNTEFGYICSNE